MTEEKRFINWYEEEKEKGLLDLKFCVNDVSQTTKEDFFREANAIISAIESGKIEREHPGLF